MEGRFAHPDTPAATDRDLRLLDGANSVQAILKSMGRNNVRIIIFGGIQIVIVGGNSGYFQLLCLGQRQLSERNANLHSEPATPSPNFQAFRQLRLAVPNTFITLT